MLVLIRKLRMRGDQIVDQRDFELDGRRISLGSGKDQQLQLSGDGVAPAHAWLRPRSRGRLAIRCIGPHRVQVAGRTRKRAVLAAGESAHLGNHSIAALAAASGFDAAIEVREDAASRQSIKRRLGGELELRLPRLRPYSYALALLALILGVGLPLAGFYQHSVGKALESQGLPTDELWSTGPLAKAHHLPAVSEDCSVCHAIPFQRVSSQACVDCHQQTPAHFARNHPVHQNFQGECRACHKEHNQPSTLIVRDKALCTDCHARELPRRLADLPPVAGTRVVSAPPRTQPVSGFSQTQHPAFALSMLHHDESGWQVTRVPPAQAEPEQSNLKFPHELHLDVGKVSTADRGAASRQALQCADCHQLDRDGEHFRPISMEQSCRGCHSLAFDDAQPDRQLPHGEPETLHNHLREYYVTQAALAKRAGPVSRSRRVPNQPLLPRCSGNVLDCGDRWAEQQMEQLFTKAGCVSCHSVKREKQGWTVLPVRLAEDWYSAARFDHRPHLNLGMKAASERQGETCEYCHKASTSADSSDVLMPELQTCVACHADDGSAALPLQCVDCHGFHRPGLSAMTPHGESDD